MNFYKHHLGDYDGATAHLSWDEDLAYRRLLSVYYRREAPIPKAPGDTYRLVRAMTRAQKEAVSRVLAEFFEELDTGWHNKRADEEIAAYQAQCAVNRSVGMRGGRPSKTESVISRNRIGYEKGNRIGSVDETESEPNRNPNQNQNHKPEEQQQSAQRSRGSRLPSGWQPSEILKAWAEKERPDLAIETTIASFRDFYAAAAGSKGVKLDWEATFRNWVRNERQGTRTEAPDYTAAIAHFKD